MRKSLQSGQSVMEGVLILAVLLIIILTLPKQSPNNGVTIGSSASPVPSAGFTYTPPESGSALKSAPQSRYISLGTGNAPYSFQPYEEYITIDNNGAEPVDITGWQLRNGKDKRPYYQAGMLQRFSADVAVIPKAAPFLSPSGNNVFSNVILGRGENAIVTTGSVAVRLPYQIVSFKENVCSGYLERLSDYAFSPPLSQNCPSPRSEPGVSALPRQCQDIIASLSSCQTPEFQIQDYNRQPCGNCLNGQSVPSYCAAFIKEHFSYQGCVASHASDANFSGRTWRIFLGRGWEMWAENYETIELFNNLGQLVDYRNY